MAARSFEPLVDQFVDDHDLVLVDLPGFAGLPHPADPSLPRYATVVARLVESLNLPHVTLVGHSTGCHVAIEAASRLELEGLVLISPPDSRLGIPATIVRFLRTALHEPFHVKVEAVSNYLWAGVHWALEVLPVLLEYPADEGLARVSAPTTVIRGEFDRVCPADWLQVLHAANGAIMRSVPGGGHSMIMPNAPDVAQNMRHAVH